MQTLGELLRELREKSRISFRHLAARVHITAPYLSDIELNRRHPSDKVLANLARALHTSVEELRHHYPKSLITEIQRRITIWFMASALRWISRRRSDRVPPLSEKEAS